MGSVQPRQKVCLKIVFFLILFSQNLPTVTPTQPPTDDCEHFCVGECACANITILDLVLIIDGSGSIDEEDWITITTSLDAVVRARFPAETARFGIFFYYVLNFVGKKSRFENPRGTPVSPPPGKISLPASIFCQKSKTNFFSKTLP